MLWDERAFDSEELARVVDSKHSYDDHQSVEKTSFRVITSMSKVTIPRLNLPLIRERTKYQVFNDTAPLNKIEINATKHA